MRHKWMLAAALTITLVAFAQKNDSPEVMLGAGLHQEEIDGNCKEAIKTYQKVIQLKNVPRNVAARAQFHIGTCEEKLGQHDARLAYEAVLNRYADQTETAVQARARIAALGGPGTERRQSTAMANRQVGALDPNLRSLGMSEDGRYIAYTEGGVGHDLFLRDFIIGENRKLPRNTDGPGHPDGAAFSRDGRQLAFSWHYDSDGHFALWVIDLQQPTTRPRQLLSLVLDGQAGGFLNWMSPTDWSPDGTQIAVYIQREDGPKRETQRIDLVNAKDGSFRTLRSEEAVGQVSNVLFSPDGKFLAYGIPGAKPAIQRDIAVTPLAGGPEIPVIVDPAQDVLVGWSPDGNHLLFTSDRSGTKSLYAIAFVNGKRQGEPVLIKQDFSSDPLRLNASGELYYENRDVRRLRGDIKIASFDFATERFFEPPSIGVKEFIGHNAAADWSRDGKYLLNISDRDRQILVIHSAETGEFVRELRPPLTLNQGVPWPKWAPDSKSIAVPATDANGRQGIFRVDAQTGEASPLALSERGENVRGPAFSPDGKKFFYLRILAGAQPVQQRLRVLIERDLASGSEKEIMRGNLFVMLLSPDGKYFTTVRTDADGSAVLLVPINGGQPIELMRVKSPETLWVETWAPDSRSVFIGKLPEPIETYFRVSIDGTGSHPVHLDQNMGLGVSLHPDGRRIAYSVESEQTKTEIWVLQNFFSALKQTR